MTFVSEWDFEAFEPIRERAGVGLTERELGLYAAMPASPATAIASTLDGGASAAVDEETAEAAAVAGIAELDAAG